MVAVTGATGFLGRHIVSQLENNNFRVLAFGRDESKGKKLESEKTKFIHVDITKKNDLEQNLKDVDTIIHSAAKSTAWGDYLSFYLPNVIGTRNVLEAAIKNGVKRFIHISSTSVYFDFKDKHNIKENDPYAKKFSNNYALTKQEAELEVLKYSDKIEIVILRPRGIIGEGDSAILPRIMKIANKGKFPLISAGRAIADITYVENVVDAILLAINSKKAAGEIFNISNDQPVTVHYLLERVFIAADINVKYIKISAFSIILLSRLLEGICKAFRLKEPPITSYTIGLLSYSQTLNINKAKDILGYKPKISIEDGIDRSVKDYITQRKWKD